MRTGMAAFVTLGGNRWPRRPISRRAAGCALRQRSVIRYNIRRSPLRTGAARSDIDAPPRRCGAVIT
jgi:hypothetical protein